MQVDYDPDTHELLVRGPWTTVTEVPVDACLRLEGVRSRAGMALTLGWRHGSAVLKPRFGLQSGRTYRLDVGGRTLAHVRVPERAHDVPRWMGMTPHGMLPANVLRLYLTFSEPMRRGQLADHVQLETVEGVHVPSPFLTLKEELWDAGQRRATLWFDPGRLKREVGPNRSHGAPLQVGRTYRLIVAKGMYSAAGARLADDGVAVFTTIAPERRPIDICAWRLNRPRFGSRDPLTVTFDRWMDQGTTNRLLSIEAEGRQLPGTVVGDGQRWRFTPDLPWAFDDPRLCVPATVEDVAGNRRSRAFDHHSSRLANADRAVVPCLSMP